MVSLFRRLAWFVLLAVAATGPARAAPASDLAAALAMPAASGLVGAKDAERFAWVENAAGVRNIWVGGPREAAHAVTRYTEDDGIELSELALSPDGKQLAFVRGGDSEFPDGSIPNTAASAQWPAQDVMLLDLASGKLRRIGSGHQPVFASDGAVAFTHRNSLWLRHRGKGAREIARLQGIPGSLAFSPDGTRLLFGEDRGDHAFVAVFDIAASRLRYLDPGLSYAVEPLFSPDGHAIAFIRYRDPPPAAAPGGSYWDIAIADAATGATRQVWRAPAGNGGRYAGTRQRNLYWCADGKLLFPWERDGWMHVYSLRAEGGDAPQQLTRGPFEIETFLLARDGRTLLFVANASESDRHRLWSLAPGGSPRPVAPGADIQSYPALAGSAVAVIASDEAHPAHVALADGTPLGPIPVLDDGVMPEPVTFRAADGVEVHGQLFPGRGKGPHPGLVFVHGGPRRQMLTGYHPMGYYSNAYTLNQHLAARGFTVLSVNYRSGTGYGLAFRDAAETGREGASEYRDVLAGGKWLAARSDVDPHRVGIWGGSWGGYLTALALARDSALFAAGADFHGVHTMLREPSDALSPAQQERARQAQWDSSPLGAIAQWRSPVLVIHGDDDKNVEFSQSVLLARELSARGVPFEELVFPNERHEFLRFADWLASYRATADFLTRQLAPAEPSP